jgi:peptide/nickel transport system permease protein
MPRLRFLARRLLFAAFLVFAVSSAGMVVTRLAPGDAATELVGEGVSAEAIAQERARLGLTRSLGREYLTWLAGAVRLDFGTSFRYNRPAGPLVAERAANTALIALAALALATLVGLPAGTFAAGGRQWASAIVRAGSVLALSCPPLVLSIILAWLAARSGWLPVGGMSSAALDAGGAGARGLDLARHMVVPVLALAIPMAATLERLQARSMVRALGQPWVAAARARGIPDLRLRLTHACRVALAPVAAVYGLMAGSLLGGSFAVEIVTAWPGLGRLMYEALLSRDVNLVGACAAAGAVFVVAGTLISDVALAWLEPRAGEPA